MRSGFALLLLACCGLTGCIEFTRQTMSYRHDSARDTLYIFQDYQGIFGANRDDRLDANEAEQLASVLKGGRTFFFSNWITEYNRTTLEEALKAPKGEINKNEEHEQAVRALAEIALANVRVENVGFYKNQAGQVCGAQRVTIQQCSRVLAALNRLVPHLLREGAERTEMTEADRQSLLKVADSGGPFIRLEGNRLEVRWPMNDADYREFYLSPQFRALRESGGSASHQEGSLVIKVGDAKAATVSLTLPFAEKPYAPNVLGEAERHGMLKAFDPKLAANEFLQRKPGRKP
jgi:hypothetical protein